MKISPPKIIYLGLVLTVLLYPPVSQAGSVAINEIVASNASGIVDEDGDTEDWIELYNFGDEPVALDDWGLSDDYENPFRWFFPAGVEIGPGEFLLVWASGKDRRDPARPLHTDFRISSAGEEILLTDTSGEGADEIPPTAIPTDISYGRWPDGTGEWFFFNEPTPGESNSTTPYEEILEPPVFSHPGGFYTEEFQLTLSHPDPEVSIVYTLDGSIPDIDNMDGTTYVYKNQFPQRPGDPEGELLEKEYRSHYYTGSLDIYDRSPEPDKLTGTSSTADATPDYFPSTPVRKGTVVQAAAFKEGAISSRTSGHTYFVFPQGNPYSLPVISLAIQEDRLFDYYDGIYTAGVDFDLWREENPEDRDIRWVGNFTRRSDLWEYPARLEIFHPRNRHSQINQGVGFRIHGGVSRTFRLKNLRLYARSRYGGENDLKYNFFPENVVFASKPNNDLFKRILLRSHGAGGGNLDGGEAGYGRDAISHKLMQPVYEGVHRVKPAIWFINGEYWGITSFRDRFDQYHLAYNYNLDPKNIIILNRPFGPGNIHNVNVGYPEDLDLYRDMYHFIVNNDMADEDNYIQVLTMLDIRSWLDYYIINIYLGKRDWGGRWHFGLWRVREPVDNHFGDGRWRAYTWDFDYGSSQEIDRDYLDEAINGFEPPETTALLRNLLENEDFKNYFINRFADHINTTFLPERIESVVLEEYEKIEPYLQESFHRWNLDIAPEAVGEQYIKFAQLRPDIQRRHIREQFSIEAELELSIDVSNRWHGHVRVNTIEIREGTPSIEGNPYPWTGVYFSGIPIELEAVPDPGYVFSHWEGIGAVEPVAGVTLTEDLEVKAHFQRSPERTLVYFWFFDDTMPNNTPLEEVEPFYQVFPGGRLSFHSALEGYPFDSEHPDWRRASLERRNSPTDINYRPEGNSGRTYADADMRGLQVRQPFSGDGGENTLVFHLPTVGCREPVFSFAARDEGAAGALLVDYAVGESHEWITAGLDSTDLPLEEEYQLYSLDFTGIDAAEDNPLFRVRIKFEAEDPEADDGGRVTFNNISLDARVDNLPPEVVGTVGRWKLIESGESRQLDLADVFKDPDDDPLVFSASADNESAVELTVEGSLLTVVPVRRGGATVAVSADDGIHPPVETSFPVLVYPEAFSLWDSGGGFTFSSWGPDEPEHSYPEHMLFLQSGVDDPGPDEPLLYPYFIPEYDYHEDDSVGFPYNNERRTRINGLGDDGVSFINTGRGRDLGGALAALDTRGAGDLKIWWLGGTLLRNEREYALRLQYRVGIEGPFSNLTADGGMVEYLTGDDGDVRLFRGIPLPPSALGEEYVQLLWRYCHISGESGPRAQLRLDDIRVAAQPSPTPSPSPTPTSSPAPSPTLTPTPIPTATPSPTPTATPTPAPNATPSLTPLPSPTPLIYIHTVDELQGMRDDLRASYRLANDIDATETAGWNAGAGFQPVGSEDEPFAGIFDGRGYIIGSLTINHSDDNRVGLFGATEGAVIWDVGLADAEITGRGRVGALAGRVADGEVRDVFSTGAVSGGGDKIGGLIGEIAGVALLTGSHSAARVIGAGNEVGGLVGQTRFGTTIRNCYAAGEVEGTGPDADDVGGLVGENEGLIEDCYATGNVIGNIASEVGGLVGENDPGGIIRRSYATGNVSGSADLMGGLAGENDGLIEDCYSTGEVRGEGDRLGGLVGRNDEGVIRRSYSTGRVEGSAGVGGLVGENRNEVEDCFWDVETSGLKESDGGTGRTSEEMRTRSTFDPPWDFGEVWTMLEGLTYPRLRWQSPRRPWTRDYSGDGTGDIAVFRPGSGLWAVRGLTRVYFGTDGDVPVPGDYDGDGTTGIAIFRGRSGLWAVRGLTRVYFGTEGDIPVPGDYTREGTSGVAVFRESSGLWAVRGLTRVYFGGLGDLPVSGYYSGEGKKVIGVYRPSSGLWAIQGVTRVYFGTEGDIPVPGDYNGRGRWAPAVFRPGSGLWAVRGLTRVYFGAGGDLPAPGGYGGEGLDLTAVFRESSGLWAVRGLTRAYFGTGGDLPVSR